MDTIDAETIANLETQVGIMIAMARFAKNVKETVKLNVEAAVEWVNDIIGIVTTVMHQEKLSDVILK